MNTRPIQTFAAAAVLALSRLGGGAVAPALAEDDAPVEVICWDMTIGGKTDTECDTVANLVAECALSDPQNTSDVCADAAAANKSRPSRTAQVPQALADSDGGTGGSDGGGLVGKQPGFGLTQ